MSTMRSVRAARGGTASVAATAIVAMMLAAVLGMATPAAGQDSPASAGAPPSSPSGTAAPVAPGTPGAPTVKGYDVEGFRSAKFGMTEPEVRKAIQVDFNIKESSIAKETNPVERTTILTITARDVLPEIGTVKIHYILGYTHKKLIQVELTWGAGVSDTAPNATNVLAAAQLLGAYFLGQSFKPENRILNAQLSDGTNLLFRATDEKGRMVALVYGLVPQPRTPGDTKDPKAQAPQIPFGRLSYIEDPKNPDVFRIKPGQF